MISSTRPKAEYSESSLQSTEAEKPTETEKPMSLLDEAKTKLNDALSVSYAQADNLQRISQQMAAVATIRNDFSAKIRSWMDADDAKPHTILIVDDDPEFSKMLYHSFSHDLHGAKVLYATSSDEALSLATSKGCTVLIADLNMHNHISVPLIEEIRRTNPLCTLIVVSAYDEDMVRGVAERVGAVAHYTKPLDVKSLTRTVQGLINGITHTTNHKQRKRVATR